MYLSIYDETVEKTYMKTWICFINNVTSLVHFEILPLVNFPEDFPCPEYSIAKKPSLFFLAKFKKILGFFPSKLDMNP